MTPKQKAKELVNKFKDFADESYEDKQNPYYGQVLAKRREVLNYSAKQCALIAVDEIIYEHNLHLTQFGHERILFWQEVKQELEKL